jgi:hypothetical protein
MEDITSAIQTSLLTLLRELINGPSQRAAFVLNRGDRGLLASLDLLSAADASARAPGRASIAAHVDHLRYGLELLNRWARGEDPWHDANFAASWRRLDVDGAQWAALRQALAGEASAWTAACRDRREWNEFSITEAFASAVHMAYHLGAIRQMSREASGPPAND